jgi:uncharacterized protein Yka (UPF0111/DUF47 family)
VRLSQKDAQYLAQADFIVCELRREMLEREFTPTDRHLYKIDDVINGLNHIRNSILMESVKEEVMP